MLSLILFDNNYDRFRDFFSTETIYCTLCLVCVSIKTFSLRSQDICSQNQKNINDEQTINDLVVIIIIMSRYNTSMMTCLYDCMQLMMYIRNSLPVRDVKVIVVSYNGGVIGEICMEIGTCSLDRLTSRYTYTYTILIYKIYKAFMHIIKYT